MSVTRTRILEEAWTADQIENHPDSLVGAAVRGVTGTSASIGSGRAIRLDTYPFNVKARRRYIGSIYGQPIATDPATGNVYTVNWRDDGSPWLVIQYAATGLFGAPFNLRTIPGDPFGELVDDSHNTMSVVVHEGVVHVWGNMHTVGMKYARTDGTGNPSTFTAASYGSDAANFASVTYAEGFILGGFVFAWHRQGNSSSGKTMLKRFDRGSLTWGDAVVLADGDVSNEGPYPSRMFTFEEDGVAKMGFAITWRADSGAGSNSGLAFIESVDFGATWKRADGTAQTMPMTHANSADIYPVVAGSGMVNQFGGTYDYLGHANVFMSMYDADGNTQWCNNSWTGTAWVLEQLTHFTSRVDTSSNTLYLSTSRIDGYRYGKQVYAVGKTLYDGYNGAPLLLNATRGADHTPAKLADMDLAGWEPSCIDQEGIKKGRLNLFLNSVDQIADSELNWDSQWAGLYSLRADASDQLIHGGLRLPKIAGQNYTNLPGVVSAVGASGDTDVSAKLPRTQVSGGRRFAKGTVLFARVRARVTFETGTTTATLYLRASPSGGSQATVDVAKMTAANTTLQGLFETPWEPIPLYLESDGTRRDTILTPRVIADNAAGIKVEGYTVDIGYLDA